MRRHLPLLLPMAALAAAPAAADQRRDPETRLARAVEGRVAGAPVGCISLHAVRSSRIIDNTAIIFDAGHTIYVNRPRSGAETLDSHDTLITRTFSGRLCSVDVVEVTDSATLGFSRPVFLGEFVPYRRAR